MRFGHQHDTGCVDTGLPEYSEVQYTGKTQPGAGGGLELHATHIVWEREKGRTFESRQAVFTVAPSAEDRRKLLLLLPPELQDSELAGYPTLLSQSQDMMA